MSYFDNKYGFIFHFIAHKYCGVCNSIQTERLVTYYNLRLDSMIELKIDADSFIVKFNDRYDTL